eukprot:127489_1
MTASLSYDIESITEYQSIKDLVFGYVRECNNKIRQQISNTCYQYYIPICPKYIEVIWDAKNSPWDHEGHLFAAGLHKHYPQKCNQDIYVIKKDEYASYSVIYLCKTNGVCCWRTSGTRSLTGDTIADSNSLENTDITFTDPNNPRYGRGSFTPRENFNERAKYEDTQEGLNQGWGMRFIFIKDIEKKFTKELQKATVSESPKKTSSQPPKNTSSPPTNMSSPRPK